MAENQSTNNDIQLDVKVNNHRFERRIAVFDSNFTIYVANKHFSAYLESDNLRCFKITDYLHPGDVEAFKKFASEQAEKGGESIFRFRRSTGEWRYNLVKFQSEKAMAETQKNIRVELIDIEEAVSNYESSMESLARVRLLMSMTDEFVFSYNKATNIFCMFHYDKFHRIEVYNMDVDEWKRKMLEKGYVGHDEKAMLDTFVINMKTYTESFSVKMNCAVRTQSEIMEQLCFIGAVYNGIENEKTVVGRVVADAGLGHVNSAMEIMNELQYDSLTGVYNKKTITEYAKRRLLEEKENRVVIAILDVDHFKSVNDTFGHLYGDKVLSRVGNRLKEIVGEDGVIGRIGGDEFMIVFTGLNDDQILRGMLRAIRTQIKWEFAEDFENLSITCSIGASIFPVNGRDFEELFRKADCCLYIAKEKGRDRYVFFRDELHRESYEASLNKHELNAMNNAREIRELKYIASFAELAATDGKKAFVQAMEHMRESFGVDNITLYYGKDMKKIYSFGADIPNADNALYIFSHEFRSIMGEGKRCLQVSFLNKLSETAPSFCKRMEEERISSTIQCYIGGGLDDIKGLVTFNKLKEASQWADYEVDCARIFASVLSYMSVGINGIETIY